MSPPFETRFRPYRVTAIMAVVLLIPADTYFLASLTELGQLSPAWLARPDIVLKAVPAFLPFLLLGLLLHYLWLLGLFNSCTVTIADGVLTRSCGPLPPYLRLEVPLEGIVRVAVESRTQHTRRGSSVNHRLKLVRRDGKTITLLAGPVRAATIRSVREAVEARLSG